MVLNKRKKVIFIFLTLTILSLGIIFFPYSVSKTTKEDIYKLGSLRYYFLNNNSKYDFVEDDKITRTIVVENEGKDTNLSINLLNILNGSEEASYTIDCYEYDTQKSCGTKTALLNNTSDYNLYTSIIKSGSKNIYDVTIHVYNNKVLSGYLNLSEQVYNKLSGYLYDDGKIVSDASVEIDNIITKTDESGYFSINYIKEKDNIIRVTKDRVYLDDTIKLKKKSTNITIDNNKYIINNNIRITYDCNYNGGSCDIEPLNGIDLSKTGIKEGYVFVGWNTNPQKKEALLSLTTNEDVTLFAIFKKILHVNINNSSSIIKLSNVDDNCYIYNNEMTCKVRYPSITNNGDYVILGLNEDANSKTGFISDEIEVSKDITYNLIYKKDGVTLTASFNENGSKLSSLDSLSCIIDEVYHNDYQDDKCSITAPKITRDNFDILGFSTISDAKTFSKNYDPITNIIELSKNDLSYDYYAITSKLVNAYYYRNNAKSMTVKGHEEKVETKLNDSCIIYNSNTTCSIKTGSFKGTKLTPVVIGWSDSLDNYDNITNINTEVNISDNTNFYAWTSSKPETLTIKFNANGSNITDKEDRTCEKTKSYNGLKEEGTCEVKPPTITREGFEILGWSTDKNSKDAENNLDSIIDSNSKTYYAITKKTIEVTFHGVSDDNDSVVKSCTIYNTKDSCSIKSPKITRENKVILGYDTTLSSNSYSFKDNTKKNFNSSISYYAITK